MAPSLACWSVFTREVKPMGAIPDRYTGKKGSLREIYLKELVHAVVGAEKYKICRAD